MRLLTAVLIVAMAALLPPFIGSAHANPANWAIPPRDYPAGGAISYQWHPSVANADYDCEWGFDCNSGMPILHSLQADELNRTAGWEEGAQITRKNHRGFEFADLGSSFASADDADHAAEDFVTTATGYGIIFAKHQPVFDSAQAWLGVTANKHGDRFYLLVVWAGAREIEALGLWNPKGHTQNQARRVLVKLTTAGWAYELARAPS